MRLHAHRGLAALALGQLDRDGYRGLLLDLLPLHALAEKRLAAYTATPLLRWRRSTDPIQPSDRLCADLLSLGASPTATPDLGELLAPFDTPAAALGCAWVIEGAALGARVLSVSLANSLGIGPDNGGAFFAQQPDQQSRWRACCEAVEAYGRSPDYRLVMAASAQATFNAFLLWLNRSS